MCVHVIHWLPAVTLWDPLVYTCGIPHHLPHGSFQERSRGDHLLAVSPRHGLSGNNVQVSLLAPPLELVLASRCSSFRKMTYTGSAKTWRLFVRCTRIEDIYGDPTVCTCPHNITPHHGQAHIGSPMYGKIHKGYTKRTCTWTPWRAVVTGMTCGWRCRQGWFSSLLSVGFWCKVPQESTTYNRIRSAGRFWCDMWRWCCFWVWAYPHNGFTGWEAGLAEGLRRSDKCQCVLRIAQQQEDHLRCPCKNGILTWFGGRYETGVYESELGDLLWLCHSLTPPKVVRYCSGLWTRPWGLWTELEPGSCVVFDGFFLVIISDKTRSNVNT